MSDWWAKKLGGQQTQGSTPPTRTPAPRQFDVHDMGQRQQVTYDAENDYVTTKATASRGASECPSCGSGNYVKVGTSTSQRGQFNVMRCYDCGYPVPGQSGADPTGAAEGPVGRAEQVHGINNYQPGTIVGKA